MRMTLEINEYTLDSFATDAGYNWLRATQWVDVAKLNGNVDRDIINQVFLYFDTVETVDRCISALRDLKDKMITAELNIGRINPDGTPYQET